MSKETTVLVVPLVDDQCAYDIYLENEAMKEQEKKESRAKEDWLEENYDDLWDGYLEEAREQLDLPIYAIEEDTGMWYDYVDRQREEVKGDKVF